MKHSLEICRRAMFLGGLAVLPILAQTPGDPNNTSPSNPTATTSPYANRTYNDTGTRHDFGWLGLLGLLGLFGLRHASVRNDTTTMNRTRGL